MEPPAPEFEPAEEEALRDRFLVRVHRFGRDFRIFAAAAIVLSAAIIVGMGFALYACVMGVSAFLRWQAVWEAVAAHRWVFLGGYALVFLSLGWLQFRHGGDLDEFDKPDSEPLLADDVLHPVASMLLSGAGLSLWGIFLVFRAFPAAVFFLGAELFAARGSVAGPEVASQAWRILREPGPLVPRHVLERDARRDPATFRRALRLLLQMRFLRVRGKPEDLELAKTLRWTEFLEASRS